MISSILLQAIVFFLPTQLGIHFWPPFSRVAGIKIDYLSPTIYFVDILLITYVLSNLKILARFVKKHTRTFSIIIIFSVLNTLFSTSLLNTVFWWLRMYLYLLIFIVFRLRKINWQQIRNPLLYGTALIVFLELVQLYIQSSVGGVFYFLGERLYSASTTGIGRLNLFGLEILRPMSTFSHSNSLAGYLLIVLFLFSTKPTKSWYRLIPFLGVILTFSKSAIIALAFIIFKIVPETIIIFSLLITIIQPAIQNYSSDWRPLSDRLFYYKYLLNINISNIYTGTGLGNFIPALGKLLPGSYITPSKLQPIHNLPVLVISELGILGSLFITLSLFIKKVRKIIMQPDVLMLISLVIFTGAFDHYSWTLPQNKLIFLLALSIMF